MKSLTVLSLLLIALPLLLLAAGQAGLLKGRMPDDLGVRNGRLKPPSVTANSVSSQAELYEGEGARYARIAPIAYAAQAPDAAADALTRIGAIVLKTRGARILVSSPDYLYVQFRSRWLKFVDDCEFWAQAASQPRVIHVRCASRLGRRDFGVNRARVEAIRTAFGSG